MKVDFYSTKKFPDWLKEDYLHAFEKTLREDNLIEGSSCRIFENQFSSYLGTSYVLGVGNGFDALRISLLALGVGRGDRVAVPSHTFIATWFAIQSVGAIPIGIDVTEDGQMDLNLLEQEKNISCVIPVHMHGTHCDMKRLTDWANLWKIRVVEDCAQAAGLTIQGKKAGTWGDVGAYSFYPTKNLFALGDGGAICTNNPDVFEAARSISRYGSKMDDKYSHHRQGQNSRLDTIQAAFLQINLQHLDRWNDLRLKIVDSYNERLEHFRTNLAESQTSIAHHYVVKLENRKEVRAHLADKGIATEMHYPKLAALEVDPTQSQRFPIGLKLSDSGLSLPISPWQSEDETEYVLKTLVRILHVSK